MSDLRKFCEQEDDILQWDQSNKNYIRGHEVSGIEAGAFTGARPHPVYDVYLRCWKDVRFDVERPCETLLHQS
jgi:hypothetical protein